MATQEIDFLAVGDQTVDDFIRLTNAHTHQMKGELEPDLCIAFGDKIEYDFHKAIPAVGNSANAAIAAARLGLKSAFLSDVGDDEHGHLCVKVLQDNGVNTDYVKVNKGMVTNYHYVLWFQTERTILVKHQEYPYRLPELTAVPRWIYLSSVGKKSLDYHKEIAGYLAEHPETKMAFQPGTFQMEFGTEKLTEIYKRTEVFFCNKEEAERILEITEKDIKVLLDKLHELGPRIVVITDGENGAYADDGKELWFMPIYPAKAFERTGAGDAFSSTMTTALALGKTVPEAMRWGPVNSASVIQYIGAQEGLVTREKMEAMLSKAPADYQPKQLK